MTSMRLDKYLKVSRIIKRRSVAKDISDSGRVKVNNKTAKSSQQVSPGDEISIAYGEKTLTVRVLSIEPQMRKEEASNLYEVIEEKGD